MTEVSVNAGVCGFRTPIKLDSEDMQNVEIKLETECPNLKPFAEELKELDGFAEAFAKLGDSEVYQLSRKYCKHPGCPIPCAIIKGIEVECGLALTKDVEIKINKV
jgi:hypothetical protein